MVADDFLHDEVEELLREFGIEIGADGEAAQARDLALLARRIGRRQAVLRLELAHALRALEPLGQQVDDGRVQVVDARPQ